MWQKSNIQSQTTDSHVSRAFSNSKSQYAEKYDKIPNYT